MDIILMIIDLPLKDAKVVKLTRHTDNRGWFTETFRQSWIKEHFSDIQFIFEYYSFSLATNTIRGLHAQTSNQPQTKLVSVLNGSIQDVLVDARRDSPTYGQSCSVILTKDSPALIYVPRGFYHGFITLEPNTYVGYKLDNYHDASSECGVDAMDKTLNIKWQIANDIPITISNRDQNHPIWDSSYKF